MKLTLRVEGFKELEEALLELPKATARNTLVRALTEAGTPIATEFEQRVRVRRGHLKASIGVSRKLTKRQKRQNHKQSDVEVYIGAGGLPQAHLEEFGGPHNIPHPSLRPAWDHNKLDALRLIRSFLAEQIERARERLARKAARLARQFSK